MQLMVGKVSLPNGTGAPRMSGGIHLFRTPPRHLEAGSTSEFLNLIVKPQRHSPVNHPDEVTGIHAQMLKPANRNDLETSFDTASTSDLRA